MNAFERFRRFATMRRHYGHVAAFYSHKAGRTPFYPAAIYNKLWRHGEIYWHLAVDSRCYFEPNDANGMFYSA